MVASRLYQGAPPREVIVVPSGALNPFAWRGIARGNGFVTVAPVNSLSGPELAGEKTFYEARAEDAIAEARRLPEFQTMMRFSQAQFWKVIPAPKGRQVQLIDLRFGNPDGAGFAAVTAIVP
jgi:hypothetical protein